MKTLRLVAPTLLVVLGWLSFCFAQSSSSKVQGVAPQGTTPVGSVNPVVIGGANGTTVKTIQTDASGNVTFTGTAVEDSTTTGQPFVMAGKDNGGLTRVANVTPGANALAATSRALVVGFRDGAGNAQIGVVETSTNALAVTGGINGNLDVLTPSGVKTSNGTTAVQIVAGVSGKRVLVAKFFAYNLGTVTHTLTLTDGATGITIWEGRIPADPGNVELDSDNGAWQTTGSGALRFSIDAGGAATDVKCGVMFVQK